MYGAYGDFVGIFGIRFEIPSILLNHFQPIRLFVSFLSTKYSASSWMFFFFFETKKASPDRSKDRIKKSPSIWFCLVPLFLLYSFCVCLFRDAAGGEDSIQHQQSLSRFIKQRKTTTTTTTTTAKKKANARKTAVAPASLCLPNTSCVTSFVYRVCLFA